MIPDKYAWHIASGLTGRRKGYHWWVLRQLPRGGREVLETKKGNTRGFATPDAAQCEADKLNAREHDWTYEELEALLQDRYEGQDYVGLELFKRIVVSHMRACRERDWE